MHFWRRFVGDLASFQKRDAICPLCVYIIQYIYNIIIAVAHNIILLFELIWILCRLLESQSVRTVVRAPRIACFAVNDIIPRGPQHIFMTWKRERKMNRWRVNTRRSREMATVFERFYSLYVLIYSPT